MEKVEVSVIIPAYNRAKTILRSVDSVLKQTFSDFEVIVVDDGSIDNTLAEIEKIKDCRLRTIRHDCNLGANAARNTGIKAARGRLVAFQDSDDEWLPTKLKKQVDSYYNNNIGAKVIYSNFKRQLNGKDGWEVIPDTSHGPLSGNIYSRLIIGNVVTTPAALVEKKLLNENLFDETLPSLQDWELFIRLSKLTPFYHIDEVLLKCYRTPGNMTSDLESRARALEMIISKHKDSFLENKDALASFSFSLGDMACRNGDAGKGRLRFSQGVLPYRKNIKYKLAYVLSYLPARYYSLCMDFLKFLRTVVDRLKFQKQRFRRVDGPASDC